MNIARKTVVVCGIVVAFAAALYFLYLSRIALVYLVVALFLAIAINPLVVRLKRVRVGRMGASLFSILMLLIILFGILGVILVPLVREGIVLEQNLPSITSRVLTNPTVVSLNQKYHLFGNIDQISNHASQVLLNGGTSVFLIASNIVAIFSTIAIILVLTFLLLLEGEAIWSSLLGFLSKRDALVAERIGQSSMKAISGFVSGNLFISLIAGTVTMVTMWILHVPYLFALAALVALFDLIPLVGAAIGTIVVGLVALTQGVLIALIAVAILLLYQFIEGHVIQPMVYSHSVKLSALLIVIASVVGALIGGIVGILLAIPVAAVVQIIVKELYLYVSIKEKDGGQSAETSSNSN